MQRPDRNCYAVEVAAIVLFVIVMALAIAACHARQYPGSRPKYGEPTQPVGPDKSHFPKPKYE